METRDISSTEAEEILEQLRKGVPPRRRARYYSAGHEDFLASVRRRHLKADPGAGKIRFVNGSWGSGKTHFFRLLTEEAFEAGYLVSTVELSANEAPFNKFERVLDSIIKKIAGPTTPPQSAAPLGDVLRAAVDREAQGNDPAVAVQAMNERLASDPEIDIDVKRAVAAYWSTLGDQFADPTVVNERQGLILQWFSGVANKAVMRREFGIQKAVSKETAREILASVVALTRHLGYYGLVVLFDESEMSSSTMSKSNLKAAQNNLLHLLNEVDQIPGLVLIYAAVPEFFVDPRCGIVTYGALVGRIGTPPDHEPRALDRVWNLDVVRPSLDDFVAASLRIRDLYLCAYEDELGDPDSFIDNDGIRELVEYVVERHGEYETVSRWRIVVTSVVGTLDAAIEGLPVPTPEEAYGGARSAIAQLADE